MYFKIGKIYKTAPPGVEQCADGSYTNARLRGRCSYHGGLLLKTVRAKKEREQVVLPDVQPEKHNVQFIQPQLPTKEVAIFPDIEPEPEPTNYYIVNSDGKVELHFEYNTYKNLPQDQQGKVKRFFNWSRNRGAWVSKAKYGDWMVRDIIKMLNLPLKGIDQRKTFAESLDNKILRAENRADRYENRAAKAEKQAEALQAEFNRLRQDWSWLTQPNVNTSGGRRFKKQREKVLARYEKGIELYQQSNKYAERAEIAKESANIDKYKDYGFVMRRIKEATKSINDFYVRVEKYQNLLNRIKSGETFKKYSGEEYPESEILANYQILLQKLDFEQSKLAFLEAKREELEENSAKIFTKERLKSMNATHILSRGSWYKIIKLNPTTVTHSWFAGSWKTPYSEIEDAKSIPPNVGQILYQTSPNIYAGYMENAALATTISLLGDPRWKELYYRILATSQNNELTLYIIYHLYNRRQMTNIPANYRDRVQNFVFYNNL